MRKNIFDYLHKDARSIQKVIKRQLVDVIITSPPFAEMKDYRIENQIGYGQNYEQQYKTDLENVFSQCLDITKATGSLWIIMDTFRLDGGVKILPFDIVNILETTENDPIFTNKTHYWLYSKGRTHKYERPISLDEWQKYSNRIKKENNYKGDIPLIVNNIEIDIQ